MHRTVILSAALGALTVSAPLHASATKIAAKVEKALAKGQAERAVAEAEAAVAMSPQDATLRHLLGRAYLGGGRFRAAAASFEDALRLDPMRANSALSLALVRIGLGEYAGAKALAETHTTIPAGDRGLALALAGDAPAGIALLETAVRAGGADAQVRQNLALAYALAGRWAEAKLMASYDLGPAQLAQRIMEWSRLARDGGSAGHVVALLGVAPVDDAGRPERLALATSTPAPVALAVVVPPPPPVPMSVEPPANKPFVVVRQPEPVLAVPAPEPAIMRAAAQQTIPTIEFAPRAKPAPAKPAVRKPAPVRTSIAVPPRPTGGRFVVQIGAYDRAAGAEAAWSRAVTRVGLLRNLTPSTGTMVRGTARFTRLSVAGFESRGNAWSFCEAYRTRGGNCFVRLNAGDAPLQWARRGTATRVASRA